MNNDKSDTQKTTTGDDAGFFEYLQHQERRPDPIGDLARDVARERRDRRAPKTIGALMRRVDGFTDAKLAVADAVREFHQGAK